MIETEQAISDVELERLRFAVEASLPDYLADLERLVNIDCGSHTKSGVDEVGRWMVEQFRDLGANIKVEPHTAVGDTVVATLTGDGELDALLVGHMDTVFDDGTVAARPYAIRNGRAFGPGVDDMKGGLLGGLYALRALRAIGRSDGSVSAGWLPFASLTYLANPDEEIGSPYSRPIIERHAEGKDVAFVLESARENGDIVSARKGIAEFLLTITGRAAHAGVEPEKGRSATVEAAHKTLALTELNGRGPGVSVNVGVTRGGTRSNVIAESAELEIDVRAVTQADMEAVEAAIREIAETSTVPDVTAVLQRRTQWWPMEKTPAIAALAGNAIELARRLGFELHDAATGGASDANTIAGLGVPTLDGLGPVGGGDHAPGEYLEVDSIVPRTTLIAALLLTVSRSQQYGETAAE